VATHRPRSRGLAICRPRPARCAQAAEKQDFDLGFLPFGQTIQRSDAWISLIEACLGTKAPIPALARPDAAPQGSVLTMAGLRLLHIGHRHPLAHDASFLSLFREA